MDSDFMTHLVFTFLILPYFSIVIAMSLILHGMPLAMLVGMLASRFKGQRPVSFAATGSVLFVGFVVPWIGMMLKLYERRLWGWIWTLSYILIFLSHFGLSATQLFFLTGGFQGFGLIHGRDWGADPPVGILDVIARHEPHILLVGSILVLFRLILHKEAASIGDDISNEAPDCRRNQKMVCWRCVEPFVFFGLWHVHILLIGAWYEFADDQLWPIFQRELDVYELILTRNPLVIIAAWLLFLTGYGMVRLTQQLTGRSTTRDDNVG